jgi:predicted AlkP superfamily pyrophosphatase or phosphodiesterase
MRKVFTGLFVLTCFLASAQKSKNDKVDRPKLVVGIVVDQMRWDYLYRYYDRYANGGFKRLLNDGFSCENTFIPYTPTYTAAGHACVYTGSVPALNGIIGNSWYSPALKRNFYNSEDSTVSTVGSNSTAGKMSPRNMWPTTITDELRLASSFKSKVIGIALKDRGSILPAGHSANAAYWFDNANGAWITSTYYMNELPLWVQQFNAKKLPDQYLAGNWNTLYPIETYKNNSGDDKTYEAIIPGETNHFPHITSGITKDKYNSFRFTPFANTFTTAMAKAAVDAEQLGNNGNTDFLAVSFSSTDYIGHEFGPNSIEAEDTYLRLDADLADLFNHLDTKVGKGQYVVFLTADHGAAHIPGYLKENKIPAGAWDDAEIQVYLNKMLNSIYGLKAPVAKIVNYQVYLDKNIPSGQLGVVKQTITDSLMAQPAIANVIDLKNIGSSSLPEQIKKMLANGYNQKLSGDMQFIFKPGWFDGNQRGTTHGNWHPYDAHIPLLFYGWKIPKGKLNRETYMTDISVTIAALLHIQMPSAAIGKVIEEVVR